MDLFQGLICMCPSYVKMCVYKPYSLYCSPPLKYPIYAYPK